MMAKPIQPTPVLKGKDAVRFLDAMGKRPKATKEEKERIKADFEKFNALAQF